MREFARCYKAILQIPMIVASVGFKGYPMVIDIVTCIRLHPKRQQEVLKHNLGCTDPIPRSDGESGQLRRIDGPCFYIPEWQAAPSSSMAHS